MTIEEKVRNNQIVAKMGLGFAFESLCNYICEEDFHEWQRDMFISLGLDDIE